MTAPALTAAPTPDGAHRSTKLPGRLCDERDVEKLHAIRGRLMTKVERLNKAVAAIDVALDKLKASDA